MERRDRPSVATFYADHPLTSGTHVELDEGATQHVHVRRLQEGDRLRVINGRGTVADGALERLTKKTAIATLDAVRNVPAQPPLRLFVPVADRERMLWLAEKCAELQVTQWQPVLFQRSASVSPRGQGEAFVRKARARMIAALEQSGGAWLPELCDELTLDGALVRAAALDGERFFLDRDGRPLVTSRPRAAAVLLGPEGGVSIEERMLIVERHGWLPVSLGETTLRFETAGVVAAGMLRALLVTGGR